MRLLPMLLLVLAIPAGADVYTRQPSVDVVHYEMAIQLPSAGDIITGSARVHVMMRQDSVSGMWLDFAGMSVDELLVGGKARPFTHRGGRLSLEFDRRYQAGEIAIVEVRYRGKPAELGLLMGKNKHGREVCFAENWPDRAHYWFPCIDHPSDKATVELAVTAPEKFDVVANGWLVEQRSLLDGRRLFRWREDIAIPTYSMVFGAAEFSITSDRALDIPLIFYSYPQDRDAAALKFARSGLVVQYFSGLIGPFPYEKLAQVQSTTRIGGMENSSVIFYAEEAFQRDKDGEGPVPHEIAHQWFGDSVTETDWDHLWISEGFATYFSALFYEHLEGVEAMKRTMARAAEAIREYHKRRVAPIIDHELTEVTKKLNPLNYQKGAWTLHMLRRILGDEVFFKGIRRYYNLFAGKNASTEDFQRVMESVSATSLSTFFKQWFYQPGWPDYKVSWRWNESERDVELIFHQAQTTGLYDMPLDIAFQMGDSREVKSVRVSRQDESVRVAWPARPLSLEVDPDGWALISVSVAPAN